MNKNIDIFPRTTRSTESLEDMISDNAFFMALTMGVYNSVHAVKSETVIRL